jgi:ABC-2 type transport system ATP-binding protein
VAVIHEPSLLILDEPFSGFDPINSEQIKNEIQELRSNGTTIIFSSHNMASVEELCSDIALLNDGKIILNGSITEIKRRFSDDSFVITYDNDSVSLSNSNLYSITEFKGNSVTVKKNSGVSTNQLIMELSKDFEITSFNKKESSLNEIFIKTIEATKQQVNLL